MTTSWLNWPNILTLSRFGFAVLIVWLLLQNILIGHILAAFCFALAGLSDLYDGYLARRMKLTSDFGKIMDPIADKVLLLSVFTVLSVIGMVPAWMVVIIAIREIWVTGDRLILKSRGHVIAAERAGKIKTVLQMVSVSVILIYLIVEQSALARGWFIHVQQIWLGIINVIMIATVIITVTSGISYMKNKGKTQ